MSPLENLGPDRFGSRQVWEQTGGPWVPLPPGPLYLPRQHAHHLLRGQDGSWGQTEVVGSKLARVCIALLILGTWAVGDTVMEPGEEQSPPSLMCV